MKRGVPCSRETVQLRREAQADGEVSFLEELRRELLQTSQSSPMILQKVTQRLSTLQPAGSVGTRLVGSGQYVRTASHDQDGNALLDTEQDTEQDTEMESSLLSTLEYMAWGRGATPCFVLRDYGRHSQLIHTSELPGLRSVDHALPRTDIAEALIKLHSKYIAWHHNCIHGPTFLAECEQFWRTGMVSHPLWMALYLSVLSVSHINQKQMVFDSNETFKPVFCVLYFQQ